MQYENTQREQSIDNATERGQRDEQNLEKTHQETYQRLEKEYNDIKSKYD